ncbi:MAG TPA: NAD-dependent epimerase/dehydratase family protein [Kofleriaceae bacterium]|nr:NAD-dependent epimerase/dehydratase family protein [Kofleriaceae bacterium]
MRRSWILIGCGYTGAHLARRLAPSGDELILVRRDLASIEPLAQELGARAVAADLAKPETLAPLPWRDALVVHLAPPALPDGAAEHHLATLANDAARIVYVSSTGVYAPAQGAWVDESWPIAPATASGAARVAAERALLAAHERVVILRAAGIYGADRGVAQRLRDGTMRIIGDGSAHTSRIHVEDLAAAIEAAARADHPSPIYNVADRDPCPAAEHADGAAAILGLPPPPRVAPDTVPAEVAGMLLADRRIDARKLERELGWVPRYPSWRDSLH